MKLIGLVFIGMGIEGSQMDGRVFEIVVAVVF
jgi:hypothetical protein